MRFLIQRVKEAAVSVDGKTIGSISGGFLVLIGIAADDTEQVADKMIAKMLKLRIFEDENGKTNLDIYAVDGKLLLISQFTLYADTSHGNRPGFTKAAPPSIAEPLYQYIIRACREKRGEEHIATGSFGADMQVSLQNDGPFTVLLDSAEIVK